MATQVQLGNFFSSNGKTVLGGVGGSGIDTKSLIEGLATAKRVPAVKLEDKVKVNESRTTALKEFQTLLSKLKDSANFLRNPPGVQNASDNVFEYTSATVASSTSVVASTYLSASAAPGATPQNYTINEITSVARAKKQTTGNFVIADTDTKVVYTTPGAGQFGAGTFTFKGKSITLADGDSLATVVSKFNQVSDDTGVTAGIVQVADGTYRISFTATSTGTDANFDFGAAGDATTDSVTSGAALLSNITFTTTQAASNAVFKVDNVEITRQTNSVADVIDGVTFNLNQIMPGGTTLDITVSADQQIAKNGVINFVNAYNDLKIFFSKQTQLDEDGTVSKDAVLNSDPVLRSTMNNVSAELSSIVDGLTGDYARLGDLGITFIDLPASADNPFTRNILTVDEGKLASALSTDFNAVRKVFEFSFTSNNADLTVFSRTNALNINDFTLNLNPATNTYEATYTKNSVTTTIQLDGTALSGGGYTLKGRSGTVLEGLTMVYGGSTAATITVKATQGIGDAVFNIANETLKENTGSLAADLTSISDNTKRLNEEIAKIDEQIERYRNQLLDKFGSLEAAISKVNSLLEALDAQAKARENS